MLYGGIEGGGSKFRCSVARSPVDIVDAVTIPTRDAPSTLAACVDYFTSAQEHFGAIGAIGFGCFGPLELRRSSAGFGRMLPTPKSGWTGVDVLEPFRRAFAVPIALDVDVAVAALAELRLGAGRSLGSIAYVTVGTGIGGAVAPQDQGRRLMHAEMGHIPVRRDPGDLEFAGSCPFHADCLEGLASGPAVRARWGCDIESLPADHPGPSLIGGYLGQLVASIALMHAVERVVLGGGVLADGSVMPHVRSAAAAYLNGYIGALDTADRFADYVCAPALGAQAGIAGALLIAQAAELA